MTERLNGKSAVVTAAGQGIGRATALAFAAEGAEVLATDINDDTLAVLAETPGLTTRHLDVTDAAAVAALAADLPAPDILFNCAGYVAAGSILDGTEEDWTFSFDLNVHGMHRVTKAFLPGMLNRGGGSVINMSSVASSMKGVVNRYAYSTTKAAIIGMTKAIAADFITQGIRCNAICPATVDTPSLHDRLRATGDYDKALRDFVARQQMGRIGTAEEIASLAVYLASDESSFTTGQTFAIDGGWSL